MLGIKARTKTQFEGRGIMPLFMALLHILESVKHSANPHATHERVAVSILAVRLLKRHWWLAVEVAFLSVLFGFALVLDMGFAASLFWQFHVALALLAALVLAPTLLSPQRKRGLAMLFGFGGGLFWLQFVALSPVKPLVQLQRDIGSGMTQPQVQQLLARHFPPGGRFRRPVAHFSGATLQFTLDPADARFDAEWLMIDFRNGRVAGTRYFGD